MNKWHIEFAKFEHVIFVQNMEHKKKTISSFASQGIFLEIESEEKDVKRRNQ